MHSFRDKERNANLGATSYECFCNFRESAVVIICVQKLRYYIIKFWHSAHLCFTNFSFKYINHDQVMQIIQMPIGLVTLQVGQRLKVMSG